MYTRHNFEAVEPSNTENTVSHEDLADQIKISVRAGNPPHAGMLPAYFTAKEKQHREAKAALNIELADTLADLDLLYAEATATPRPTLSEILAKLRGN